MELSGCLLHQFAGYCVTAVEKEIDDIITSTVQPARRNTLALSSQCRVRVSRAGPNITRGFHARGKQVVDQHVVPY